MLKLRLAPFAVFGLCAAITFAQESAPNAGSPGKPPAELPRVDTNPATDGPPAEPATGGQPAESDLVPSNLATPRPAKRKAKPKVAAVIATPIPVATPEPKKSGLFKRMFGKKEGASDSEDASAVSGQATPAAVSNAKTAGTPKANATGKAATPTVAKAKATPAPTTLAAKPAVKKAQPKKVEVVEEKAAEPKMDASSPAEEKPADLVTEVKPPEPKVLEEKPLVEKKATPAPKLSKKEARAALAKKQINPPPEGENPEALEKWKYDEAKAKSVGDARIQELKTKADGAPSDEEARKALRAYNQALYDRMREIDPSIKERVDRMEAAVLRRLGE